MNSVDCTREERGNVCDFTTRELSCMTDETEREREPEYALLPSPYGQWTYDICTEGGGGSLKSR